MKTFWWWGYPFIYVWITDWAFKSHDLDILLKASIWKIMQRWDWYLAKSWWLSSCKHLINSWFTMIKFDSFFLQCNLHVSKQTIKEFKRYQKTKQKQKVMKQIFTKDELFPCSAVVLNWSLSAVIQGQYQQAAPKDWLTTYCFLFERSYSSLTLYSDRSQPTKRPQNLIGQESD